MRIYRLGLVLFIVASSVGIAGAAEKGLAKKKCVQACLDERTRCMRVNPTTMSYCNFPAQMCMAKCK